MTTVAQVHRRARHIRRVSRMEEQLLHVSVLIVAVAVVLLKTV